MIRLHKPLQVSYWARFKLLLRGLVFYNTVYWQRASDGLNPPKLTKEERKLHAPPKNLDVIKPREQPRARIDEAKRREMLDELARLRNKTLAAKVPANIPSELTKAAGAKPPEARPPTGRSSIERTPVVGFRRSSPQSGEVVKVKRRKRRAHRAPSDELPSTGFLARFIQKWMR